MVLNKSYHLVDMLVVEREECRAVTGRSSLALGGERRLEGDLVLYPSYFRFSTLPLVQEGHC